MLVTRAVPSVDVIPRSGHWNLISKIYMWSICSSFLTLMTSVLCVSLSNIKDSVGLQSEHALLGLFITADIDESGDLDKAELLDAVRHSGFDDTQLEHLSDLLAEKNITHVTFPDWYDIVERVCVSDGLAAHHSCCVSLLVRMFLRFERRDRKKLVSRRAKATGTPQRSGRATCMSAVRRPPHDEELSGVEELTYSNGTGPPYPRDIEIRVYKEPGHLHAGVNGTALKAAQPEAELDRRHSLTLAELGREEEQAASNHPVVTESELIDPSDLVGRKVSGLLDAIMSVLVPVVYGIAVCFLVLGKDHEIHPTEIIHRNQNLTGF